MQTLFIASRNVHKVEEFRQLLESLAFRIEALPAEAGECPEDGHSFEANAMEKAAFYGRACGAMVLADDSGLCVDALNGAPGVLSARYAGTPSNDAANNAKLLDVLRDIPDEHRTAEFVSVLALWNPVRGQGVVVRGAVKGRIGQAPRGANGFGYDPLFIVPSLGRTYAEMSASEKAQYSHRGRAVKEMLAYLGGQADEIVRGQ